MALKAAVKRGWIRSVYRQAQTDGVSFLEKLEELQEAANKTVSSGSQLAGSGKAGLRVDFFSAADSGLSPADIAALALEAIEYCEAAAVELGDGATDLAIRNKVLSYIPTVREVSRDFSALSAL